MPKSSGVGLAGLGCAGSYPALEIPVRCHLAFRGLDRRSPSDLGARDKRTRTATRDKSPFASTKDRAGDGRERFGVGHAVGNGSDRLSWPQATSAVDRSLCRRPPPRARVPALPAEQDPVGTSRGHGHQQHRYRREKSGGPSARSGQAAHPHGRRLGLERGYRRSGHRCGRFHLAAPGQSAVQAENDDQIPPTILTGITSWPRWVAQSGRTATHGSPGRPGLARLDEWARSSGFRCGCCCRAWP